MAQLIALLLFMASLADTGAKNVQEMEMRSDGAAPLRLLKFSWKSCSTVANPLVVIKNLSLSTDPIVGETSETVSFTLDVKTILEEGQKLSAKLKVLTDEGGGSYVDLCPLFQDYCTIDDICMQLSQLASKITCPDYLTNIGIQCTCPIKAKEYKITKQLIPIPTIPITGSFDVTMNMFYKGEEAGCWNMKFCLNECTPSA